MGQILYNGFDDDSDSEDEFDALFWFFRYY
jgi:hypothetical protein